MSCNDLLIKLPGGEDLRGAPTIRFANQEDGMGVISEMGSEE